MSKLVKAFWLFSLVFFVGACSSYRGAAFPNSDPGSFPTRDKHPVVKEGDNVRITLTSESVLSGRVVEVTKVFLTLEPSANSDGNFLSPVGIHIEKIGYIEIKETDVGRSLLLGAGVVLGLTALIWASMASSYNGINWTSN